MTLPNHAASVPSSQTAAAAVGWAGLSTPLAPSRSLRATLIERLSRDIRDGTLQPGSRLPTEQQLGAALGVSRTVVREAIAALRADGLVVARQGSGMFVAALDGSQPFRIDADALASLTNVLNLMELRTGVESEAAGFAAARRTQSDLAAIDAAMAGMTTAIIDDGQSTQADFDFHRAVMQAAHNPYFVEFQRYLSQFISPRTSVRAMAVPPGQRAAYLRRVQAEHRVIRDAIAARDESAARAAAQRHLRNSRARFGKLREALQTSGQPRIHTNHNEPG